VRDEPAVKVVQLFIHDNISEGIPAGEWRTVRVPFKAFREQFKIAQQKRPTAFVITLDTWDQDLGLAVGRIQAESK
jgi:hypothetical protein